MYNYLLFRWLCFRNCDDETKAAEITLAKYMVYLSALVGKAKKQKGRLKCESFCNGHCAYECPNAQIDYFESKYNLPAYEIGLSKIKCSQCMYYDRYMTCKDCYFRFCKECRFTNNISIDSKMKGAFTNGKA